MNSISPMAVSRWRACARQRRQSLRRDVSRGGPDPQAAGGTIYKIAADGTFTVLVRFTVPPFDGTIPEPWLVPEGPLSGLTLGPDGFFYARRYRRHLPAVAERRLRAGPSISDEAEPQDINASLILGADGVFYERRQRSY